MAASLLTAKAEDARLLNGYNIIIGTNQIVNPLACSILWYDLMPARALRYYLPRYRMRPVLAVL